MIDDHKIIPRQQECPCCGGWSVPIYQQSAQWEGHVNLGGRIWNAGIRYNQLDYIYTESTVSETGTSNFESYQDGTPDVYFVENDIVTTGTASGTLVSLDYIDPIDQESAAEDGLNSVFDNATYPALSYCSVAPNDFTGAFASFEWLTLTGSGSDGGRIASCRSRKMKFVVGGSAQLSQPDFPSPELTPPPYVKIVFDIAKIVRANTLTGYPTIPVDPVTSVTMLDEDITWQWDGIPDFDPQNPTPECAEVRKSPEFSMDSYFPDLLASPLAEGVRVEVCMINVRVYLSPDKWGPWGLFWDGTDFEYFENLIEA